jgi:predicted TPR repeat methyltransferase
LDQPGNFPRVFDRLFTSGRINHPLTISLAIRRAQNLRDEGEILAAYACQLHASMLTPEASEVWLELGELAHILGRRQDARRAYEEYLLLCPDDAEILHILSALKGDVPPLRAPDQCIRQLYSRFADHYEYNMCNELDYQAYSLLAAAVAEAIAPHDSMEILDLGCGTGLISEQLRPLARHLTGIDLSPEMIEHARRRGFYDLLEVAEITEWVGRDSGPAFDLIVACDTFIYFGDLSQVIRPLAARLVQGGTLAFTVEKGSHNRAFELADSGRYTHTIDHISFGGG